MPFVRSAARLALALAVAAPVAALAQTPAAAPAVPPTYPVKDFFRNSPKASFRLSDDGRTLGFMQPA